MPLPNGIGLPWPPKDQEPILHQYATWAAWYAGDVDALAGIYSGDGAGGQDTTGFFASEAGGFKGTAQRALSAVRRWFWGTRQKPSQPKTRLHVPMAGDIASASADLLFSEPPSITIPDPPTPPVPDGADPPPTPPNPTQDRIKQLIDDGTHATLLEAAEICAAMGGVYLRVVWDPAVRPGRPWIAAAQPDVAIPEWSWGRLSAVTFWRELARKGKVVVRHLERYEPGRILHGVYEGTVDELGRLVPLTDYPETAGLAASLVDGNEVRTGATKLTAVYVPNMRPNRIWRSTPAAVHLGRSDFAGVEPLMDALDLVYSSWMRDVDLGKARLVVPREYMQSQGRGQGATVDLDQEVYEPINVMGSEDGKTQIEQVQFDIRVEEHERTVDHLKMKIVESAGYSPQTFGIGGEVAVTATEVAAKNQRSYITRGRKTRYWAPELANLIEALLQVDVALFGTPGVIPQRPQIEWAPAVSVDPLAQAQTLRELHTAEAISNEQKVRTLHPDWDDTAVDEEVQRIREDHGGTGDPAFDLAALAGNQPPGGPGQGDVPPPQE
jgi:hypothetical protein